MDLSMLRLIWALVLCSTVFSKPTDFLKLRDIKFTISTTFNGEALPSSDHIQLTLKQGDSEEFEMMVEAPYYGDPAPEGEKGFPVMGLWNYEVVEAFFLNDEDQYLEVEIGPHGHHLVLLLNGQRNTIRHSLPLELDAEVRGNTWVGKAYIPANYLPPKVTRFNAYAIHGTGSDRVYKSLYPAPADTAIPDFHDLSQFKPINLDILELDVDDLSPIWQSGIQGIFRYEVIPEKLFRTENVHLPSTSVTLQGFQGGVEINYTIPTISDEVAPKGVMLIFRNSAREAVKIQLPVGKDHTIELLENDKALNPENLALDYYIDTSKRSLIKGSALVEPSYFPPNITMLDIFAIFKILEDPEVDPEADSAKKTSRLTSMKQTSPIDFNLLVQSNVHYSPLWASFKEAATTSPADTGAETIKTTTESEIVKELSTDTPIGQTAAEEPDSLVTESSLPEKIPIFTTAEPDNVAPEDEFSLNEKDLSTANPEILDLTFVQEEQTTVPAIVAEEDISTITPVNIQHEKLPEDYIINQFVDLDTESPLRPSTNAFDEDSYIVPTEEAIVQQVIESTTTSTVKETTTSLPLGEPDQEDITESIDAAIEEQVAPSTTSPLHKEQVDTEITSTPSPLQEFAEIVDNEISSDTPEILDDSPFDQDEPIHVTSSSVSDLEESVATTMDNLNLSPTDSYSAFVNDDDSTTPVSIDAEINNDFDSIPEIFPIQDESVFGVPHPEISINIPEDLHDELPVSNNKPERENNFHLNFKTQTESTTFEPNNEITGFLQQDEFVNFGIRLNTKSAVSNSNDQENQNDLSVQNDYVTEQNEPAKASNYDTSISSISAFEEVTNFKDEKLNEKIHEDDIYMPSTESVLSDQLPDGNSLNTEADIDSVLPLLEKENIEHKIQPEIALEIPHADENLDKVSLPEEEILINQEKTLNKYEDENVKHSSIPAIDVENSNTVEENIAPSEKLNLQKQHIIIFPTEEEISVDQGGISNDFENINLDNLQVPAINIENKDTDENNITPSNDITLNQEFVDRESTVENVNKEHTAPQDSFDDSGNLEISFKDQEPQGENEPVEEVLLFDEMLDETFNDKKQHDNIEKPVVNEPQEFLDAFENNFDANIQDDNFGVNKDDLETNDQSSLLEEDLLINPSDLHDEEITDIVLEPSEVAPPRENFEEKVREQEQKERLREEYQRRYEDVNSGKQNNLLPLNFKLALASIEKRKEAFLNSFNENREADSENSIDGEIIDTKVKERIPTTGFGVALFPPAHPICITEGLVADSVRCQVFYECVLNDGEWEVYNWRCKRGFYFDSAAVACLRGYC